MSQFKITGNKGFHMTFDNGYTVSVQFGAGNYCDNYDFSFSNEKNGVPPSTTAECAAFNPNGDFIIIDGKDIHGYSSADQVAHFISDVSAMEPNQ